jgi:outer membrane receptor protein involved in Fe transport
MSLGMRRCGQHIYAVKITVKHRLRAKRQKGALLLGSSVFSLLVSSLVIAQTVYEEPGKGHSQSAVTTSSDKKPAVLAQQKAVPTLQTVTVTSGPSLPLVRVTEDVAVAPAHVTVIGRKELDRMTINTYGDILRNRAGINVIEYNQGLVAYGISVRGFDEGHGRNLAVYLDGMPLNVTGSQHTNGYADQAQIIPELLNRVEVTRGPFSVLAGNHAVGGSLQLFTDQSVKSSFKFQVDHFGRSRALPIVSVDVGPGHLLAALDLTKGNGYTKQSNIDRVNFFGRYSVPVADGQASIRVQSYTASADSPGYRDRDQIRSGLIDKHSKLNYGIGDAKTQSNVVLNYRSDDLEGATGLAGGWFASLYYNRDVRRRWTNFNIALPPNSEEPLNQERDLLHQVGFDLRKTTSFDLFTMPSQFVVGFQLNSEEIDAQRRKADSGRHALSPTLAVPDVISVKRKVYTNTQAFYTNYQLQPFRMVKLTAGLRYDWLHFRNKLNTDDDTYAQVAGNGFPTEIRRSAQQISPKFGAVISVYEDKAHRAELYGNIARGLKSPYAFSDYYQNVAGANASIPDLSISSLWSFEYGLKASSVDGRYNFRIGFWNTQQDKESNRNAAGFVQSFQKTTRDGFDVEGDWNILPETRIFANYSQVRARIKEPVTPGEFYVPLVPKNMVSFGVESVFRVAGNPLTVSLMDSWIGTMPISSNNQLHTHSYHRYTLRAAYTLPASLRNTVISANIVGYSRQFEEVAFDFGSGAVGTSPSPRARATFAVMIPI